MIRPDVVVKLLVRGLPFLIALNISLFAPPVRGIVFGGGRNFFVSLRRQDARFGAKGTRIHVALVADEDLSASAGRLQFLAQLLVVFGHRVAALVGIDLHWWHISTRRELPAHCYVRGVHLIATTFEVDALHCVVVGLPQAQNIERPIHGVAAHVAQTAGAELPPLAPVDRMQIVVVVLVGSRPNLFFPVHVSRHRPGRQAPPGTAVALADGAVGLGHLADCAGPDVLAEAMVTFPIVALVAHGGVHLVLFGHVTKHPALPDVVGQRLLEERVNPAFHSSHRRRGMMVVRCGDQGYIQILVTLVEHSSVVVIDFGLGIGFLDLLEGGGDHFVVDIHNRDQSL